MSRPSAAGWGQLGQTRPIDQRRVVVGGGRWTDPSEVFQLAWYGAAGRLFAQGADHWWLKEGTVGYALSYIVDEWVRIPRAHIGLIPRGQPQTLRRVLEEFEDLLPYQDVGLCVVDKRTLLDDVIHAGVLAARLPHIGEPVRHRLLVQLQALVDRPGAFDVQSIREMPSGISATATSVQEMDNKVAILCSSSAEPERSVLSEGEELFPVRLLPNDDGVEFRSGYIAEYRAVGETDRLAQAKLVDAIARRHKLVVELTNNESALAARAQADGVDPNELGAMFDERHRVNQEIASQQSKLSLLEKEHADLHQKPILELHRMETSIILPFGETIMEGRVYFLRSAPMSSKPPASPTAFAQFSAV